MQYARLNRYSGFDILPFDKEQGFRLVEQMRGIADARRATVAQVAIAWLLSRAAVTSVLIGATKRSQLDNNLKAGDLKLSEAELAKLDAATALAPVYPNWFIQKLADQRTAEAIAMAERG